MNLKITAINTMQRFEKF